MSFLPALVCLLALLLSGCSDRRAERALCVLAARQQQAADARLERIERNLQAAADERRQDDEAAQRHTCEIVATTETAAPTPVENTPPPVPEGTRFLVRTVNVPIRGGLSSLVPGTEVAVVRENPDGTLHVREAQGPLETDLPPAWTTDDPGLAADLRCADDAAQAQAAAMTGRMQARAAWRQRYETIRAGLAMDDAAGQFQRTTVPPGSNPLDGSSY